MEQDNAGVSGKISQVLLFLLAVVDRNCKSNEFEMHEF